MMPWKLRLKKRSNECRVPRRVVTALEPNDYEVDMVLKLLGEKGVVGPVSGCGTN